MEEGHPFCIKKPGLGRKVVSRYVDAGEQTTDPSLLQYLILDQKSFAIVSGSATKANFLYNLCPFVLGRIPTSKLIIEKL